MAVGWGTPSSWGTGRPALHEDSVTVWKCHLVPKGPAAGRGGLSPAAILPSLLHFPAGDASSAVRPGSQAGPPRSALPFRGQEEAPPKGRLRVLGGGVQGRGGAVATDSRRTEAGRVEVLVSDLEWVRGLRR